MPFEMDSTISIHAPRKGGDGVLANGITAHDKFQSTPPARGATTWAAPSATCWARFQSTPPARGAT